MKENQVLLADPVYSWELEKEYIWQDDAACAFQPSTLFEVAFHGDPVAEGLTVNETHDLNETNLRAAQKICNGCPVWDQCYTSAESEDFEWTMRAGIMPTKHVATPVGRPSGATSKIGRPKQTVCRNGHDDWATQPNGKRYCVPCKKVTQGLNNAKRPLKGRKLRETIKRDSICRYGHDAWIQKANGTHYCSPCRREREAQAREAKSD